MPDNPLPTKKIDKILIGVFPMGGDNPIANNMRRTCAFYGCGAIVALFAIIMLVIISLLSFCGTFGKTAASFCVELML